MKNTHFDLPCHPLGKSRYRANRTPTVAHGCVAYMDVGEGHKLGTASFTTT